MPVVWPCETVCLVRLWREMAEEEDGGFAWPDEDGADEDYKVVHHVLVPVGGLASMVKGEGKEEEE